MINYKRTTCIAFLLVMLFGPAMFGQNGSPNDADALSRAKSQLRDFVDTIRPQQDSYGVTATPAPNSCSSFAGTLGCGSNIAGSLSIGDCTLSDGTYADLYVLNVSPGQRFTVSSSKTSSWDIFMTVQDYDTGSVLTHTTGTYGATLTYTATSSRYVIGYTSLDWYAIGSYTLSVACSTSCTAPTITSHPQSVAAVSGSATLAVAASGTAPLAYQWYLGAKSDTSRPILNATNPTQGFTGITENTSVWVRVTNACGQAESNGAMIYVAAAPSTCIPDANTACLLDNRFRVRITFTDNMSNPPKLADALTIKYAENAPATDPTWGNVSEIGFFTFYSWAPKKVEVIVKLLKGVMINNKFWVYVAGMIDNDFTVTVTDTRTGVTWSRHNPQGGYMNAVDQGAFPAP